MPKIVRFFEVKAPTSTSSLLKSLVKEADEPTIGGNKMTGESATQYVLGHIFSVPTDSVRVILFLNDTDLKTHYLVQGGEKNIAAMVNDADLAPTVAKTSVPHLLKLVGTKFDLDDAANATEAAHAPYAVLLNVKKQDWKTFETAASRQEKRAALQQIISHRYYAGVLNTIKIKAANVGHLRDEQEREQKFDIKNFITAFPNRAMIDAARAEYDKRLANAPGDQAAATENNVNSIAKAAMAYAWRSVETGDDGNLKLKVPRKKFEAEFMKIIRDNPAIKGNEHLMGDVLHIIANTKTISRIRPILGNLIPAPDDAAPAQEPAKDKSGKKIEIPDVDNADVPELAQQISSNPRIAKALVAALKGYGFTA